MTIFEQNLSVKKQENISPNSTLQFQPVTPVTILGHHANYFETQFESIINTVCWFF